MDTLPSLVVFAVGIGTASLAAVAFAHQSSPLYRWRTGRTPNTRRQASDRVARFTASAANEIPPPAVGTATAGGSGRAVTSEAWTASERLSRLSAHAAAQEELLPNALRQLGEETEPLRTLLGRQSAALGGLLNALDGQLAPFREFAAREEANLHLLEDGLQSREDGALRAGFASLAEQQRERLDAVRAQIEAHEAPLRELLAREQSLVELALQLLDDDLASVEDTHAQLARTTARMLEGLRSQEFAQVSQYLRARLQALEDLSASGVTDRHQLGTRLRAAGALLSDEPSSHIARDVLAAAAAADAQLVTEPTGGNEPREPERVDETGEEPAVAA